MSTGSTTRSRTIEGVRGLHDLSGQEIGVSEWVTVDQTMIDSFAETTGDRQWIHVDVERAQEESPFETTVAHGYLILSLAGRFGSEVFSVEGMRLAVNYGLDRVRFTAPVPSGLRVRARITLGEVRQTPKGTLAEFTYEFESDVGTKPVCIAKALGLFID